MNSEITQAERLVIKVGSSSLTGADGSFNQERVEQLASQLSALRQAGKKVVLVTSGSIAAALAPLGLKHRPRDLETQQAAAAVGQGLLIQHYTEAFARHGVLVAQLLLTVEDVLRKTTYRNALNTISRLFRLGVIPIINENDTVATHEIRFGDNDRLAALVAHLVRADGLLLLTDVDGLYTAHPDTPGSQLIKRVEDLENLTADTSRLGSKVGTGGMHTKLQAARIATHAGVNVVLTHADLLSEALAGQEVGTFFPAQGKRRPRRLLWLAHAAKMRGRVHVDGGAKRALVERNASLLAAGVVQTEGQFVAEDPIEIIGPDGQAFARGFVGYDSAELIPLIGHSSDEEVLEGATIRSVVHRDQLILL